MYLSMSVSVVHMLLYKVARKEGSLSLLLSYRAETGLFFLPASVLVLSHEKGGVNIARYACSSSEQFD